MIEVAPVAKLYLATRPVSMRYGFDGLHADAYAGFGRLYAADPATGQARLLEPRPAQALRRPPRNGVTDREGAARANRRAVRDCPCSIGRLR